MKRVGEHRSWDEHFWAYAVDAQNRCVLVRCASVDDAIWEKDRMKMSDAIKVGYSRSKRSELEMRKKCREAGWNVTAIR